MQTFISNLKSITLFVPYTTVCKVANKNCRVVYDVWNRCWDSVSGQVARGGVGLMDSWYDACAGKS